MYNDIVETGMESMSRADQPVDYSKIIEEEAFIGEYPLESILEGIETQFDDYINIEDKTNYVDIFYNQLHHSYAVLDNDIGEEHPQEIRTALDVVHNKFINKINELIVQRLMITIQSLESEDIDLDELELIFRRIYEFFVLNARETLKTIIAKDINSKIRTVIDDDRQYYKTITDMLEGYSPLITAITPMEFLRYGNTELYDMYDDGKISGNFLRKFSPKLYQNEEFEATIIAHITMINEVKDEIYGL